jgi:3'(2'), 5'-bisphosphate nucleotidase
MLNTETPEVKFALQAVRLASLLVRQVQSELVSPALTKEDRSPVTVADFASQALIAHQLAETFPHDLLVAEEDSRALQDPAENATLQQITRFVDRFAPGATEKAVTGWIDHNRADSAPRFWTLDPIDGTKGFLRGDQYAVALALVEDGQVLLGALGCPNLADGYRPDVDGPGTLVIAVRGQGAWAAPLDHPNGFTSLHVSSRSDPKEARILRSFESGHTNVSQIDRFAEALGVQAEPIRMDSQAKYAVLASGKGELILRLLSPEKPNYREKIWDQAAGALVLEEAGGRITDLQGNPLDFTTGRMLLNNRGVLASNGRLHEAALQALQKVGA